MKDTGFYVLIFEDIEKYGFEGLNQTQQDEVKGLVMKAMEGRVEKSESDYEQEKMRAVEKIDQYWRNQTQELQEKQLKIEVLERRLERENQSRIETLEDFHKQKKEIIELKEKLETMTQERKRLLKIAEMIQYYWIEKQFFNQKLMNEAYYYFRQGYNPFPKLKAKLDQWLEENNYSYVLQHDVFRFVLIRDSE